MSESILEVAQRLTHGDRQVAYGHPLDNYQRFADAVNAIFKHKLREDFAATDLALIMAIGKIAREVHKHSRDNCVDGAGYFWVTNEVVEESLRRADAPSCVAP